MKSKIVPELIEWIKSKVEEMDLISSYKPIIPLVEIAELELLDSPLLENKINEFKQIHLKIFEKEQCEGFIIDTIINNSLESTSKDKPFIIPVEFDNFVRLEYELIEAYATKNNNFFEWNREKQSLINENGKKYDVIDIVYKLTQKQKKYKKKTFYFDITKKFAAQYDPKNIKRKSLNDNNN